MTDGAQIHFKTDDGGLYQSTMRYLRESGFEILWYTTNLYENGQPPADNITTEHEQRFTAQELTLKRLKLAIVKKLIKARIYRRKTNGYTVNVYHI